MNITPFEAVLRKNPEQKVIVVGALDYTIQTVNEETKQRQTVPIVMMACLLEDTPEAPSPSFYAPEDLVWKDVFLPGQDTEYEEEEEEEEEPEEAMPEPEELKTAVSLVDKLPEDLKDVSPEDEVESKEDKKPAKEKEKKEDKETPSKEKAKAKKSGKKDSSTKDSKEKVEGAD